MQLKSRLLLTSSVTLVVAAAIIAVVQKPKPSDEDQIGNQIGAIAAATQSRDVTGIMAEVSNSYHDPVISNADQLAFFLRERFRNDGDPLQVTATTSSITVTGASATSVSNVHVVSGGHSVFDGNITLDWKKEPSQRLLIIPDTAWQIVSAHYPSIDDLGGD